MICRLNTDEERYAFYRYNKRKNRYEYHEDLHWLIEHIYYSKNRDEEYSINFFSIFELMEMINFYKLNTEVIDRSRKIYIKSDEYLDPNKIPKWVLRKI